MIYINNQKVNVKKFPNGEQYIDIDFSINFNSDIKVTFLYDGDDSEFFILQAVKDYLDDNGGKTIILEIPYIPYSRMDRQENNRLFTLKTFANLINSMNFKTIITCDPHSDVSLNLIKNCITIYLSIIEINRVVDKKDDVIVFPDKGAKDRYIKFVSEKKKINYIEFEKKRDFDTGKIISIDLTEESELFLNKNKDIKRFFVIDDLCARGGTFIGIAKKIKAMYPNSEINLVVTHCEDTVANGELHLYIDKLIVTTDSILKEIPNNLKDKIHILRKYRK